MLPSRHSPTSGSARGNAVLETFGACGRMVGRDRRIGASRRAAMSHPPPAGGRRRHRADPGRRHRADLGHRRRRKRRVAGRSERRALPARRGGALTALRPAGGGDTGSIRVIVDAGNGEWLVGADSGLYRLGAGGADRAPAGGRRRHRADPGHRRRRKRRVAGRSGQRALPARRGGALTALRPADGGDTGRIMDIVDAGNGEWLVGTGNGLYRLGVETSVEVDQSQVTDVPNAADHTFRWVIHNPCVGILPDADLLEARLATSEDWQQVVVQRPGAVGREAIAIDFTRALNAKSGSETVTATLGFRPTEADEFEPLAGSENTVHVNWSWRDYASDYLRRYWRKAVATYFALFGALMIASRRSRWAWGVVTDPWWGKVGLPYWFALRHCAGVAAVDPGPLVRRDAAGTAGRLPACAADGAAGRRDGLPGPRGGFEARAARLAAGRRRDGQDRAGRPCRRPVLRRRGEPWTGVPAVGLRATADRAARLCIDKGVERARGLDLRPRRAVAGGGGAAGRGHAAAARHRHRGLCGPAPRWRQ